MELPKIKLAAIALVATALNVGSTLQAQGTAGSCGTCGFSACSAGGCYGCNAVRQVGSYQNQGQTCTIYQACTVNCPGSAGACPSWGATWKEPSSLLCQ
jgi:hypothetical protein